MMQRHKYIFGINTILVLLLWLCLLEADALGNGSSRGRASYKSESQKQIYNGLGYANGDHQMRRASVGKPVQPKLKASRGLGLSAWGIIGVLGGSLLAGTVAYYAVIFYPILCKKERKTVNGNTLDCCPTAPPALDNSVPAVSTPV